MPVDYMYLINCIHEPVLPLKRVSGDCDLRELDTSHYLFFTTNKITALKSIYRLHSSGGKLSGWLCLVLIAEGWASIFD